MPAAALRAGGGALDDEGRRHVPVRREGHEVLVLLQPVEGVRRVRRDDLDAAAARVDVDLERVAQDGVGVLRGGQARVDLPVDARPLQVPDDGLAEVVLLVALVGHVRREERLDRDVAQLQVHAELAREDHDLARHVLAGQIFAHVGLRVAVRDRLPERVAERLPAGRVAPEHVRHRAAQAAADGVDPVARQEQILHRREDGQRRADARLVAPPAVRGARGLGDALRRAAGPLATTFDGHTMEMPAASHRA